MGASASGIKAAEQPAAESLLTAFKTLSAGERRRHASVLNYWLSVRGEKEFPPLHDLDPLELSDAGANSILMELISGGHDAEIRHLGEALRDEAWPERIIDAPNPSVLSCIAKKLPIVAISRDFLAFEDEYETSEGKLRCSATLLPLSAGGAWVDYVYALVTVEPVPVDAGEPVNAHEDEEVGGETQFDAPKPEIVAEPTEPAAVEQAPIETAEQTSSSVGTDEDARDQAPEPEATEAEQAVDLSTVQAPDEPDPEIQDDVPSPASSKAAPGFSKILDSLAGLTGFYGSQPVRIDPVVETPEGPLDEHAQLESSDESLGEDEKADEPFNEESPASSGSAERPNETAAEPTDRAAPIEMEESLQNKLTQVRAKADEARLARLRAESALCEGLGAAYDFALDAEDAPEEYLRLVEAQGLKIQLRSPMKPVVKLAFASTCDEPTIKQLEAVLAWAFDQELPRGTLSKRIEAAGGIEAVAGPQSTAA